MKNDKVILGISAFYHDSAVCYIKNGTVVAALQEERFSRKKFDESFPVQSIEALKKRFGLKEDEISAVAFYDKPLLKFERIIENLIYVSPKGFSFAFKSIPLWMKDKMFIGEKIRRHIKGNYEIVYVPHHISHAASAFYPSNFERAAFLVNDGVGEWESTSTGVCGSGGIELRRTIDYPHSLGMLYSAFTYFCGFTVNSGEYKLMGLAPYGEKKYVDKIMDNLIDIKDDGSYRLNMRMFDYQNGSRMCGKNMEELLGIKIRKPEDAMTADYADIAASIQYVIEDALIKMAKNAKIESGEDNLVMAGGVSLNCVANTKIIRESGFSKVFIQPASGDAGGALGAALYAAKNVFNQEFEDVQNYSLLGTEYSDEEIESVLKKMNAVYTAAESPSISGAEEIASGNVVGWFQGRMEYGPRALGSRSILGSPIDSEMQKKMNLKIKFRESFRPFAPSILEEEHNNVFEETFSTPYMLTVSHLKNEFRNVSSNITHDFTILQKSISQFPAVVHADFTSRVQTVNEKQNPMFYGLIKKYYEISGSPMVINTSFNVRGQPIVESPEDAFITFIESDIDILIIGGYILKKTDQTVKRGEYKIVRHND